MRWLVAPSGQPLTTGVEYNVYEAARDEGGKRKRVVRSYPSEGPPRFPLPAGRYYVTAESAAGKGDAEVDVAEGQVKPVQLRLGPRGRR